MKPPTVEELNEAYATGSLDINALIELTANIATSNFFQMKDQEYAAAYMLVGMQIMERRLVAGGRK